ncbi:MAG TPA: hypothetical protein VMU06_01335 [Stellaceae bacterium]|nr:hypothetical protein [Stellaceae bacterium]
MSVLTKLKPAPGGNSTMETSSAIAERIRATEAEIARLDGDLGQTALAEFLGAEGATEKATALCQQMEEQRTMLTKLKSAHIAALEREEIEQRRVRAQLARTQIRNVKECLKARDEAAVALNGTVAEVCRQFRILIDKSAKAKAACPLDMKWPNDALCDFGDLRRLTEEALWKHGGNPAIGARDNFPGGKTSVLFAGQPENIPDLAETIKKASSHVLAALEGSVKG